MLKKIGLAMLIPCMGGCIWHDGSARSREERGSRHESHRRVSQPIVVDHREHVHGPGCGHVLRGGIWITIQ